MAAKLIKPKSVRGVRKEMQCNGRSPYTGVKGCGAVFTFVPSDTREVEVGGGNGRQEDEGPRYKVRPVERQVSCPGCNRMSLVEVVRPGEEYSRQELDLREAFVDIYGRGQGGR